MTASNVKENCERHSLINTCVGASSCQFSGPQCTVTALTGCDHPMRDLSKSICSGRTPPNCPGLRDVYAYMHNWDNDACGTDGSDWCTAGKRYSNKWALCAQT